MGEQWGGKHSTDWVGTTEGQDPLPEGAEKGFIKEAVGKMTLTGLRGRKRQLEQNLLPTPLGDALLRLGCNHVLSLPP